MQANTVRRFQHARVSVSFLFYLTQSLPNHLSICLSIDLPIHQAKVQIYRLLTSCCYCFVVFCFVFLLFFVGVFFWFFVVVFLLRYKQHQFCAPTQNHNSAAFFCLLFLVCYAFISISCSFVCGSNEYRK